jgi:D-glycero-D-manno-heptose 1,7-bisphosphate phosphatase
VRAAVFLDRDGTLNRELEGALARPEQLELLEGAPEGAARLARAGFALVIVTNQSAVARGLCTLDEVRAVHAELARRLGAAGAAPAGVYLCPHHPDLGHAPYRRACACRKPASGLLRRAARELALDLSRSWIVGDALRDLRAGRAVGARALLVETGKGAREAARLGELDGPPPARARDLTAAADWILAQGR